MPRIDKRPPQRAKNAELSTRSTIRAAPHALAA